MKTNPLHSTVGSHTQMQISALATRSFCVNADAPPDPIPQTSNPHTQTLDHRRWMKDTQEGDIITTGNCETCMLWPQSITSLCTHFTSGVDRAYRQTGREARFRGASPERKWICLSGVSIKLPPQGDGADASVPMISSPIEGWLWHRSQWVVLSSAGVVMTEQPPSTCHPWFAIHPPRESHLPLNMSSIQ